MKEKRLRCFGRGVVLTGLLLCWGCETTRVVTAPYTPGRILLLPPRDLVQKGLPHAVGAGSGALFQEYLKRHFAGTAFELITTDSKAFSALEIAEKEKGLEIARSLKADYCLQIVLGEFLNAAPMTCRPDYVYLDQAYMYNVRTGKIVWQLVNPLYLQKGNPGNHYGLLDAHARTIVRSICGNVGKPAPSY